jgi:hypothetical protein
LYNIKIVVFSLLTALFCFSFSNCSSGVKGENMNDISYLYSDGSGNTYSIKKNSTITVEYSPVKKKFSSSGVYDGGKPVIVNISETKYHKLIALFKKAIQDEKNHIENRSMGSGFIKTDNNGQKKTYILKMNANTKQELEQFLEELIKQ